MKKEKNKEKKKHSTGILVLWCFIMFILGAFAMCGVFYALSEHADVEWRSYIENTLIPNAVAIVTSLAATLLILRPAITNIVNIILPVINSFKQATDDVNATVTSSARSEEEVYKSRQEIASIRAELDAIKESVALLPTVLSIIKDTKEGVEDIGEVSRIGFGSMAEHVKNGAAKKIMNLKAIRSERSAEDDENKEA